MKRIIIAIFISAAAMLAFAGWRGAFDDAYFKPATGGGGISCEILVVAGGGGGCGPYFGGSGGAGGLVYAVNYSVSAETVVIVGQGGVGSSDYTLGGDRGSNSVFGTLEAIGGGGSHWYDYQAPFFVGSFAYYGGSGGGGGAQFWEPGVSTQTSPAGATGYGHDGGRGYGNQDTGGGGGGGGAGADGGAGVLGCGGDGGDGLEFSQFASVGGSPAGWFAGGGGGAGATAGSIVSGLGGAGGGGDGSVGGADDGVLNTGGGGGGSERDGTGKGGDGGSGIVIVRYQSAAQLATGGYIATNGSYIIHAFTNIETTAFTPL